MVRWCAALAVLALLSACGGNGGARDIDYTQERGISADIAASHATGPISTTRGRTIGGEPLGSLPGTADERHAD